MSLLGLELGSVGEESEGEELVVSGVGCFLGNIGRSNEEPLSERKDI